MAGFGQRQNRNHQGKSKQSAPQFTFVLAAAGVLTFALAGLGKSVLARADQSDKEPVTHAKTDKPVVEAETANQTDD